MERATKAPLLDSPLKSVEGSIHKCFLAIDLTWKQSIDQTAPLLPGHGLYGAGARSIPSRQMRFCSQSIDSDPCENKAYVEPVMAS